MIDIGSKTQSLLAIQKKAANPTNTNNRAASDRTYENRTWNKTSAHAMEIGSSTSPTRLSLHLSRSPPDHAIHTPVASHTRLGAPSASSTLPSLAIYIREVCNSPPHSKLNGPVLQRDALKTLPSIRKGNAKKKDDLIDTNANLEWFSHFQEPTLL